MRATSPNSTPPRESLTWNHQVPVRARRPLPDPIPPGVGQCALRALANDTSLSRLLLHSGRGSLPLEACMGWSCQHRLGRSVLGVSELLGAHWEQLSKCS